MTFKTLCQTMRLKSWIKNILIFIPVVFAGTLFEASNLIDIILAFISFSFVSSFVYIYNDIKDIENDRLSLEKCNRPIASGKVKIKGGMALAGVLIILGLAITFQLGKKTGFLFQPVLELAVYVCLNLGYSMGLKNIPLVDVFILALGFMLRVFYGGAVLGISVSNWVYLTIFAGSLYLSLGKRRNELCYYGAKGRKVLKGYTIEFLDKGMQIFMSLCLVFYSLACASYDTAAARMGVDLIWTVPLVTLICLKYYLDICRMSEGDPVSIILEDKPLFLLIVFYIILVVVLLYMI